MSTVDVEANEENEILNGSEEDNVEGVEDLDVEEDVEQPTGKTGTQDAQEKAGENGENDDVKAEIEATLKNFKLSTRQVMEDMQWLMHMFYLLGEAEAKGVKTIRDETTATNWTAVALNRKKRTMLKSTTKLIDGNYEKLFTKSGKKKKRKIVRKEGFVGSFSRPRQASQTFVDFINASNLEMEYKGEQVKLRAVVTGLDRPDRLMTANLIMTLFRIWAFSTPMVKNGKTVWPSQFFNKRICVTDPIFKKYFGETMEEIKGKKLKVHPEFDTEIVVNQGTDEEETVKVFYKFVYIMFSSVRSLHETKFKILDKQGEPNPQREKLITERLAWEYQMLREHLAKLTGETVEESAEGDEDAADE